MKKFITLFLLVFFISGCSNPFIKNEPPVPAASTQAEKLFPYAAAITINDTIEALKENQVLLGQTDAIKPADFVFDGITPVVFEINNSGNYLLIYDYKTIVRLKDAGLNHYFFPNDRYYPDVEPWYSHAFTAKNVLMILRLNADLWTGDNWPVLNDMFTSLNQARYELSEGKSFTFAGNSKSFAGRLKVIGYKYWYKDETGGHYLEQDAQQKWEIRYLGPDPESIDDMHYSISVYGGFGSCSGSEHGKSILRKIGDEYYLPALGNDNHCPDKDTIYTLKVKLNQQKSETLLLRNIQPTLAIFMNESFNAAFLESLD